jgi:hypothetical protein
METKMALVRRKIWHGSDLWRMATDGGVGAAPDMGSLPQEMGQTELRRAESLGRLVGHAGEKKRPGQAGLPKIGPKKALKILNTFLFPILSQIQIRFKFQMSFYSNSKSKALN